MTDTILAHAADTPTGSLLRMLVLGISLTIPLVVLMTCVFWPARRAGKDGGAPGNQPAPSTSMYEELWELIHAVEHNRFTRADLKREDDERMACRAGRF